MGVTQPPLLSAAGPHARVGAPTATGFGVLSFSSAFLGPCGLETHLGSETHGQSRGLRPSRLGPLPWAVSPRPGLRSRPVWHRFRHRCGFLSWGLFSALVDSLTSAGISSLWFLGSCALRLLLASGALLPLSTSLRTGSVHACACVRMRVHVHARVCTSVRVRVTCPRTPSPACVLPSPFGLVLRTESSP